MLNGGQKKNRVEQSQVGQIIEEASFIECEIDSREAFDVNPYILDVFRKQRAEVTIIAPHIQHTLSGQIVQGPLVSRVLNVLAEQPIRTQMESRPLRSLREILSIF